jgi:hypothetical protein
LAAGAAELDDAQGLLVAAGEDAAQLIEEDAWRCCNGGDCGGWLEMFGCSGWLNCVDVGVNESKRARSGVTVR